MRIRKHASKILGTASSLSPPRSPPPSALDAFPAGYICVLNQSPWDVLPPSPPHNQQEAVSVADSIKGEEPISAITRTIVVHEGVEEVHPKPNSAVEEVHPKPNSAVPPRNQAKGKKVIEKNENGQVETTGRASTPTYTCKKTDGKQWRCKRLAPQPNSLCDYHLAQIKSYNSKAPSVGKAATSVSNSTRRKRVTMPAATLAVSDIYYYSAFGPWRGKQRGGGDIGQHRSVVTVEDGESEREKEIYDNMDVSDDEETSDDSEIEEKQALMDSRKKRRKPVKARSLKSLM